MKRIKLLAYIYIIFSILCIVCNAEDVLFIDNEEYNSSAYKLFQVACNYYGLNVDQLILNSPSDLVQVSHKFELNQLRAIVITANSLQLMKRMDLLLILTDLYKNKIPLLVMRVSSDFDISVLNELSQNLILGFRRFISPKAKGKIKLTEQKKFTHQLAGIELPLYSPNLNCFIVSKNNKLKPIIFLLDNKRDDIFPTFFEIADDGQEIFFLIESQNTKSLSIRQHFTYINKILPIMIFLRYVCDNKCWHSPEHFANLTIDDPCLTESYGHLNYKSLCNDSAHFHTTIGFIPWNFDRSESNMVNLFKKNPDKLSICIHGNNHDHYEFYKYETDSNDTWPAKPLRVQETNIIQAVARMEKHKELTGLDYDKVMIFPHNIAPEKTLGLLKKYNFLATVNANNVPLGAEEPKGSFFDLRSVTLEYANFPSFKRYSPERSEFEIALDLFLDNPLFFYVHHDYFEKGIDAFNETAEMVNRIQSDITWQSLGYIAKHYYLERLRDDGNYDVKAFTNHFIVENQHKRDITYYIEKEESFSIPIKQITVKGEPYSYERSDNQLMLKLNIPKGESREVFIEYENDLDLASVDISKNDPRVNRLRRLSDFRDMVLSKNVLGRLIMSVYYDTGLYKFGLRKLVALFLALFIFSLAGTVYIIKLRQKRKAQN